MQTTENSLQTLLLMFSVFVFEDTGKCGLQPTGVPSCGGDVAVYIFDINQPSMPTPFYSVLVSVFIFMAFSTIFHSINSPDKSLLSHSVPLVLFPPFLVLSTIYLFMTVSPNESLPKWSRSGELWKQKLRSHLLRTQSLKVFL